MHLKVDTKLTTPTSENSGYIMLSHMAVTVKQPRESRRHMTKWQPRVVMISISINPSNTSYFL